MNKFSAATQRVINISLNEMINCYSCETLNSGIEIERMYLRLRSRSERIDRAVKVLDEDIRYHSANAYNTQQNHRSYGRDFRFIMMTSYLLYDEKLANVIGRDISVDRDDWTESIDTINQLHENVLNNIFVDPADMSRHIDHLLDCIHEYNLLLMEREALNMLFEVISSRFSAVINNIRENDDETIEAPIQELNIRHIIEKNEESFTSVFDS